MHFDMGQRAVGKERLTLRGVGGGGGGLSVEQSPGGQRRME